MRFLRQIVLSFSLTIFFCTSFSQKDSLYLTEDFSFLADSGRLKLNGVLTIPKSFGANGKLIILVAPPSPIDRDYGGLFKSLADTLTKSGIAVLRFDNRAFVNKSFGADGADMFDQAIDVHDAFVALRKDSRFAKTKIGLLGHSEGGASAAIETSQNLLIEFVVILSASGINGSELSYKQLTNKLSDAFPSLQGEQKQKVFSAFKEQIEIVANNESVDSMKLKVVDFVNRKLKEDSKFFGKQTPEQAYEFSFKAWLNQHRIAYIKYEPQLYYSKIKCPALVMFGTFDEMLDYKENIDGIENIFKESGKKDYQIVAIDSINHGYRKVNRKLVGAQSHPEKLQNYTESKTFSPEAWATIVKWVKQQ